MVKCVLCGKEVAPFSQYTQYFCSKKKCFQKREFKKKEPPQKKTHHFASLSGSGG
jgi:hypothetical protein